MQNSSSLLLKYTIAENQFLLPRKRVELTHLLVQRDYQSLLCAICHDLLENAMMCNNGKDEKDHEPCGHTFCQDCICKSLRIKSQCPLCRRATTMEQLVPNMDKRRMVREQVVVCPQREAGCPWQGALGKDEQELKKHVDSCPHTQVTCSGASAGCEVKMKRAEMIQHAQDCPLVTVRCRFEMCNQSMLRRELKMHESTCPLEPLTCPYAPMGCLARPYRKDMSMHETNEMGAHLKLAVSRVTVLESADRKRKRDGENNADETVAKREKTEHSANHANPPAGM